MNWIAFILLAGIGLFMVYEVITLIQKIVDRRKKRKAKSKKEVDENNDGHINSNH